MKTQNKKITLALLLLTTFFFSCNKNDDDTIVEPTIYVVGDKGKMWKSEQGADFTETVIDNDAVLKDIFLEGDDIYIGGDMPQAQIWKNGEPTLQNLVSSSISNIFVQNGDVYGVGFSNSLSHFRGGVIWKNGIVTDVEYANDLRDIYVKGNDVYMTGLDKNTDKPVLIKNGVVTPLSDFSASANSIFITDNDDVYICGSVSLRGVYWKNGEEHTLTVPTGFLAEARSIYVDGDDVYVCGLQLKQDLSIRIATVWKNGEPTNLTDSTQYAEATDVVVHNGDVYVCGVELNGSFSKSYAILWKNGERTNLTDGEGNDAASALAIK